MDKEKKLVRKFETIAWGLLFMWWGFAMLIHPLPEGAGIAGSGLILVGLNLARKFAGIATDGFSTTLGILALVWGGYELARPLIALPFEIPLVPILLIVLGVVLFLREMIGLLKKDTM